MASKVQFSEWLAALVRQNEQEPLGYPERLELERNLLHAFQEAKEQEQRADEALHNQIESQKDDWQKAISSLRKAAEENAAMRALLERISRSVPIILREGKGEELDEWQCPVCSVSLPVPWPTKPPPHPFPHAESCALAQTSAFLASLEA